MDQRLAYIREYYGVDAEVGKRVRYTGDRAPVEGEIVGARGGYIRVRLDNYKVPLRFHPTWRMEYL